MSIDQAWAQLAHELLNLGFVFFTAFGFRLGPPVVIFSIGVLATIYHRRKPAEPFWTWAFPSRVYKNPSFWVDVKLLIVNHIFSAWIAVNGTIVMALYSQYLGRALAHITGTRTGAPNLIATTAVLLLAGDFCFYVIHRFHHGSPLFWPFHAVHHSAEEMSPITAYRYHPFYSVTDLLGRIVIVGTVQGLLLGLFFNTLSAFQIAGTNMFYLIYVYLGSNFRHSHIWIRFWPPLEYIFISPAMHQVHHSTNPRHFNKNYGEVFAIWDWLLGTLYLPHKTEGSGAEVLQFGLAGAQGQRLPQPYPTFAAAMGRPIAQCARRLFRRS